MSEGSTDISTTEMASVEPMDEPISMEMAQNEQQEAPATRQPQPSAQQGPELNPFRPNFVPPAGSFQAPLSTSGNSIPILASSETRGQQREEQEVTLAEYSDGQYNLASEL